MYNRLVEIPYSEWPELRELYVNKKVEASGYYALQILSDWAKRSPEIGIRIYSLNGQWREDGTFIAIMQLFSNVFCNTLAPDLTSLKLALSVFDPKPFYRFFGFSERLVPAIKEFFTYCGLSEEDFKPDGTAWYHISKEKAQDFVIDPPEGICLRPVDPSYSKKINSFWDHRYRDSEHYVRHLLTFNESVGAFDSQGKLVAWCLRTPDDVKIGPINPSFYMKINSCWAHRSPGSDIFVKNLLTLNDSVGAFDEQGNLIAWCLRLPLGSMGVLQVEDTYKRKGLGSLLVRSMSKKIVEKNEEILAPVVFKNGPSRAMFEKLGFEVLDNVYWINKKRLY